MKKIAIYGAGGFGREVACMLKEINILESSWELIGFFDDGLIPGHANRYGKVLGGIDDLNNWNEALHMVFSIANPAIIQKIVGQIHNPNILFPSIWAPNVLFLDRESVTIGKGNVIFFGARISCDVIIGDFNLFNGSVSLGHDVVLGDFNVLGPMVRISGNTRVGDSNFFGVQSIVLQGLQIGSNTRIGPNSVIMRNTRDHFLYMGNPAKKVIL